MRLGVKAMESTTTAPGAFSGGRECPRCFEYDYTVRDGNRVVQFRYNGTGLNPAPRRTALRMYIIRTVFFCHQTDLLGAKYQTTAGCAGAFADLPTALQAYADTRDDRPQRKKA